MVPIIWAPITVTLFYKSLAQQGSDVDMSTALTRTMACFFLGNFIWTLLEYTLHRFLFHIEEALPDRPFFLMLHFLLHGIHHYLPVSYSSTHSTITILTDSSSSFQMDGLRLVMPPLLFTVLQAPFTKLAHSLFPSYIANGIIAGAFTFYIGYDLAHVSAA